MSSATRPSPLRPAAAAWLSALRHPPPQIPELSGIASSVAHGVLNYTLPQVILNKPSVRVLIGEGKATGMAQHMGMNRYRPSLLSVLVQYQVGSRAMQGPALLT